MSELIIKGDGLCIRDGGYVTDDDGAPCVCGDQDPGPCLDGYGQPPFIPCGAWISVSGVQSVPMCEGLGFGRGVTGFAGVNGTHYIDLTTGSHSTPCNISYRAYGPSFDETGAILKQNHQVGIGYCGNDIFYLTGYSSGTDGTDGGQVGTPLLGFLDDIWRSGGPGSFVPVARGVASQENANPIPFCEGENDGWGATAYGGGKVTLVAVLDNCEDIPSPAYKAISCDGTKSIWVSLEGERDGWNALHNGILYTPVDEQSYTEPPVAVQWVQTDCVNAVWTLYSECGNRSNTVIIDETNRPPNANMAIVDGVNFASEGVAVSGNPVTPDGWTNEVCDPVGDVYERCDDTYPSVESIQTRIRVPDAGGANTVFYDARFILIEGGTRCRYIMRVHYRKIADDGGEYISRFAVPSSDGCKSDRVISRQCDLNDDQPDDPTQPPNFNRGQALPPIHNPQSAQIKAFGCRGCGDPGVF